MSLKYSYNPLESWDDIESNSFFGKFHKFYKLAGGNHPSPFETIAIIWGKEADSSEKYHWGLLNWLLLPIQLVHIAVFVTLNLITSILQQILGSILGGILSLPIALALTVYVGAFSLISRALSIAVTAAFSPFIALAHIVSLFSSADTKNATDKTILVDSIETNKEASKEKPELTLTHAQLRTSFSLASTTSNTDSIANTALNLTSDPDIIPQQQTSVKNTHDKDNSEKETLANSATHPTQDPATSLKSNDSLQENHTHVTARP
jgi:hypothetical protein